MQSGNIRKKHGSWHLRYWAREVVDGQIVQKQKTVVLARVSDEYRSKVDVWPLAEKILAPLNRGSAASEDLTVTEFVEKYFLPYIGEKRKPSTKKFYKEVHENHLRAKVGGVKLRQFTTRHAQEVLDSIKLSHQSLLRIKTGMSAIFSYAARLGIVTVNPVREA